MSSDLQEVRIPDAEIAITKEMLEAGATELDNDVVDNLRDGFTTRHTVAECVFRAMLRASCATR